jgi:hypothetical protein
MRPSFVHGPMTFRIGVLTVVISCPMEGAAEPISSKATKEEILAVVAITRLRCGNNCVMIGLCMTSEM